jgi:hypothetical protein
MFLDVLSVRVTVFCLILSVAVTAVYTIRVWYRRDVDYDVVAEWLAHGTHGPTMAYMSGVMLGMIPIIVPFNWLAIFYAITVPVFVIRLMFGWYKLWWWEILHIIANASMAYMFLNMDLWIVWWTLGFIAFYIGNTVLYSYYIKMHRKIGVARTRTAQLLSDAGHHGMAVIMVLMFLIMQWPMETARLSGVLCGPTESGLATNVHKHSGR